MFVKICGTTSEEDALLAVAMGADALGFVFAPSPRQVTTTIVADIVKRLPPEILTVGVFRNQSPERVVETVHATAVKAVQLHGDETPDMIAWVRKRGVNMVIKGMAAGAGNVPRSAAYGADVILLDAPSPGSGQVFDWTLAEGVPPGQRFMLAGGLTPENVADAITQANPWGVDVVTGVESEPGRKDARKLRAFISAAKGATRVAYRGEDRGPYDWQDDGA